MIALLLGSLYFTGPRQYIVHLAAQQIARRTGLQISIRNLDIPLLGGTFVLHDVALNGPTGRPWFAIDKVEVDVDTGRLAGGVIWVPEIRLTGVYGGVQIVNNRVEPVESLIDSLARFFSASTTQSEPENESPSEPLIGRVVWQGGAGYFAMDKPAMFVTVPDFRGEITFPAGGVEIHTTMGSVTYVLFDWPFQTSAIDATVSIYGDDVTVKGEVQLGQPQARLSPLIEANAATGRVRIRVKGTAAINLVNQYYTSYPRLSGEGELSTDILVDDEFSLSASVTAAKLKYENRLRLSSVAAAIHMNDERIWIDRVSTSFANNSGSTFSATGSVLFWPAVAVSIQAQIIQGELVDIIPAVVPATLPVHIGGKFSGNVSAEVSIGDNRAVHVGCTLVGGIVNIDAHYDAIRIRDSGVLDSSCSVSLDPSGSSGVLVNIDHWIGDETEARGTIGWRSLLKHGKAQAAVPIALDVTMRDDILRTISDDRIQSGIVSGTVTGDMLSDWQASLTGQRLRTPVYGRALVVDGRILGNHESIALDGLRILGEDGMFFSLNGTVNLDPVLWNIDIRARDLELNQVQDLGAGSMGGTLQVRGSLGYDGRQNLFYPGEISVQVEDLLLGAVDWGTVTGFLGSDGIIALKQNDNSIASGFFTADRDSGYGVDIALDLNLSLLSPWINGLEGTSKHRLRVQAGPDRPFVCAAEGELASVKIAGTAADWARYGFASQDLRPLLKGNSADIKMSVIAGTHDNIAALAYSDNVTGEGILWHYFKILDGRALNVLPAPLQQLTGEAYGLYSLDHGLPSGGGGEIRNLHLVTSTGIAADVTMPTSITVREGHVQVTEMPVNLTIRALRYPQIVSLDWYAGQSLYFDAQVHAALPLLGLIIPQFSFFDGAIVGQISGLVDADGIHWDAAMDVAGGTVLLPELGLKKRVTGGRVTARDMQWRLSDFVFEDASGRVGLEGDVTFNGTSVSSRLKVAVLRQKLQIGTGIRAEVSGNLDVRIEPGAPVSIDGTMELRDALLSSRIDWELALLKFQRRSVARLEEIIENDIRLNIYVRNNSRIRIDNNLAAALVDGDFSVIGSPRRIGLSGNLQAVEGTLFWQGVSYKIGNALVQFVDPAVFNPVIDLEASALVPYYDPEGIGAAARTEYKVILTAYGPLKSLQLNLTSTPALEQVDILSLLMFGVLSSRLTGGNQDSASQIQLTNLVLGTQISRFEAEIEGLTGFDKFEMRPTFNRGADTSTVELSLEKRLSDRLRIRLQSSVDKVGEQRFGLDYNLSDHLSMTLGWDNQTDVQIGNFSLQPALRFPLP